MSKDALDTIDDTVSSRNSTVCSRITNSTRKHFSKFENDRSISLGTCTGFWTTDDELRIVTLTSICSIASWYDTVSYHITTRLRTHRPPDRTSRAHIGDCKCLADDSDKKKTE